MILGVPWDRPEVALGTPFALGSVPGMLEKHALEAPCERPLRLETPWECAGNALGSVLGVPLECPGSVQRTLLLTLKFLETWPDSGPIWRDTATPR